MRKSIYLGLTALLSVPFTSLADTMNEGVLQAYWLPQWNGNVNTPELELRFFVFSTDGKQKKVIDLDSSTLDKNFIEKKFGTSASEFLRSKEGHIEQSGNIVLSDISGKKECDSTIWQAKYVSFEKKQHTFKIDENNGVCNSYPYLISYQLKSDVKEVNVMDKPSDSAKIDYQIDNQHTLVKIKTVDANWFYVAEYDESQKGLVGEKKGYVKANQLSPLN